MSGGKSMQNSLDRIFDEVQKNLYRDEAKTRRSRDKAKTKTRPHPGDRMIKKAFAKHWVEIQKLHDEHSKTRRTIDHILRKQSKLAMKKWRSELMKAKLAADEIAKESDKLTSMLRKNKPILKMSKTKKVSEIHRHFRNSDAYVAKLDKKKLKEVYYEMLS